MAAIRVITTAEAPAPIGTYSQAVRHGDTVYLSGQIGLDPATMELAGEGVAEQSEQVLRNLAAVCRAAGGDLDRIVKLTVYLVDLDHFTVLGEAMARHFTPPFPARATVEVAALPRGALVEVEGIMVLEDGDKLTS